MGVDHALACADCRLFIDLHKWPIIDEAHNCLIGALGLPHRRMGPFKAERDHAISSHPLVRIQAEQIERALCGYTPEQPYIATLIPYVRQFILEHKHHFLFLTCDIGERPWDIGEPVWFDWKEIRAAFDYDSRFLPRNLVDDYRLTSWEDVLQFYRSEAAWMLDEQLADDLEALRSAYERLLQRKMISWTSK